ncbi:hypothetical protein V1514DRAFT_86819 [Lipomyces japonicus]|uniref:uncharacterized protein n=1 Tax=Lipomyces japonicus TaxID=56871 RepID=UPI0034CDA55B
MGKIHSAFKEGFESVCNHLETPSIKDLYNFLGYCFTFGESLLHHHETEDEPTPTPTPIPNLSAILNGMKHNLFTHLDDEIRDLSPERLRVFEWPELKQIINQSDAYAKKNTDPFIFLPFFTSHIAPDNRD